ncbi:MAG TPA: helix-hairpin-helix domain-containing protein [Chloroflexaceae bacterium]|nr:helix-hairpin-helix domain-containing protein [Chloroflexaceae bacterium]
MPRKRTWFFIVAAALLVWLRPWRAIARRLRGPGGGAADPAQTPATPREVIDAWRPAAMGAPTTPHPEAAFAGGPEYGEADAERLGAILDRNAETIERAARDEAGARGLDADAQAQPPAEFAGPTFFGPGDEAAGPGADLIDEILAQDEEPDEETVIGALNGEGADRDEGARELQATDAAHDDIAGAPRGDAELQEAEVGAQARPDDLLVIEGIGPRTSTIVTAAGLTSFADLAAADVEQLRQALADAGIKTVDPTTWPEQARLAADGRWDELKALQDRIRNGRIEDEG